MSSFCAIYIPLLTMPWRMQRTLAQLRQHLLRSDRCVLEMLASLDFAPVQQQLHGQDGHVWALQLALLALQVTAACSSSRGGRAEHENMHPHLLLLLLLLL